MRVVVGRSLILGLLVAAFAPADRVEAQPTLVVLVRHGEKLAQPADDPSLSPAGVVRAHALDSALAHTQVSTIVVSTRKRTVETASPVATRTHVTPMVIALDGGAATHVAAVAAAVQSATGVVLVVGHSNTIPAIIGALGGPKLPDLCDANYASMFVLTPPASGRPAQLVTSSYGVPDAAGATVCTPMTPR